MGNRRITRTICAAGILLVGGELVARVWVVVRAPEPEIYPWGHDHPPRAASNFVSDPFTGFALDPAFEEHSAQGLRERAVLGAEHEGHRIVALGGSNTYGTQVAFDDAFPRVLETQLQSSVNSEIEVINAGVGAFTSAHQIGHLALRVLDLAPDVCLFDLGYTDCVARVRYGGFRADYTHDYRSWERPRRAPWRASVLLDRIASRLGFPHDPVPSIHDVAQWPYSADFAANFEESSPEPFRRNLVSLVGICIVHGVTPVLCTQAVDFVGHPSGEYDAVWVEAMRQANDVTREVATEMGVTLIDVEERLGGRSELFTDERRMNADGNRQRAAHVLEVLLNSGVIK